MQKFCFTLLASAALVLSACGTEGPQGPAGEDGAPGADGADGQDGANGQNGADGQDGADGQNGADGQDGVDGAGECSGQVPLASVVVDGAPSPWFTGVENNLTYTVTDDDGTDVTATTEVAFIGSGATLVEGANPGEFTLTFGAEGGPWYFGIVVSDGCTTTVGDLVVEDVIAFRAGVSVVHVFEGAGDVKLALTGTTDGLDTVSFQDSTGFLPAPGPSVTLDVLDPADDTLIVTTPTFTVEHEKFYTVVVHDDGAGAIAFTAYEENIDPSDGAAAGDAQIRLFHAAPSGPTIDVTDGAGGVLFDDLAPGTISAETVTVDDASDVLVGVDLDADGTEDLVGTFADSDLFPDEMSTGFIHFDNGELVIYARPVESDDLVAPAVFNTFAYLVSLELPPLGPPVGPATVVVADSPELAIPDQDEVSITATVAACGNTQQVSLDVNYTHTFEGDLRFELTSPAGAVADVVVGDPSGSANVTLQDVSFPYVSDFRDVAADGDWTLTVVDTGGGDVGTLHSYSLNVWCN